MIKNALTALCSVKIGGKQLEGIIEGIAIFAIFGGFLLLCDETEDISMKVWLLRKVAGMLLMAAGGLLLISKK